MFFQLIILFSYNLVLILLNRNFNFALMKTKKIFYQDRKRYLIFLTPAWYHYIFYPSFPQFSNLKIEMTIVLWDWVDSTAGKVFAFNTSNLEFHPSDTI